MPASGNAQAEWLYKVGEYCKILIYKTCREASLFLKRGNIGTHAEKKGQNQKKPEKTGLLSFFLTAMSNVFMFTTSAIPVVTTVPLPGRLLIPVALMDPVPGVTLLQPLVLFAPDTVSLTSIML